MTTEKLNDLAAHVDRLTANVDRLTKNVENGYCGGYSSSIRGIIEMILLPGLRENRDVLNHNFTIASPRKTYSNTDGGQLTEIDLLLESCDKVMVVEVKYEFALKWMHKFLERLEILRKHEHVTKMVDRPMYAAIAGVNIDSEARALAVENGMYIIEIEEEQERVKVIPPEGKAGTW